MRALTDQLGWKVFALFASFLLWYLIAGETEVAANVPVVVQYRNLPPDLEITGQHLDHLFLKLRGPQPRLTVSALGDISVALDMATVNGPGEQTFNISERELGLPFGVTLVRAVPAQIRVNLQRRGTKRVPVAIRYASGPPAGYRIASERVSPEQVLVVGPELQLERLQTAATDPVDLSNTVGAGEFRVPVYVDNPQLRIEGISFVQVRVSLARIP